VDNSTHFGLCEAVKDDNAHTDIFNNVCISLSTVLSRQRADTLLQFLTAD
jgi:hypothetical protein